MTALDVPGFGVFEGGRAVSLRGRWILVPGGTAQTRPHRGPLAVAGALAPWRRRSVTMPLLSGALVVNEPVHLTVGEISVAVDKTRSVRLTLAEVTALGNRRYAVDVIASALGPDAGPDETIRLEGSAARVRDGALRVTLTGSAPKALIPGPGPGSPESRGAASSGAASPGSLRPGSLRPGSFLPGSLLPGSLLSSSLLPASLLRRSAPATPAAPAAPAAPTAPRTPTTPAFPAPGALIVSPTRGAGFRLKLIATFAR